MVSKFYLAHGFPKVLTLWMELMFGYKSHLSMEMTLSIYAFADYNYCFFDVVIK